MVRILSLFLAAAAFAASVGAYSDGPLSFPDAPRDRATRVAATALLDAGIVRGNPDGTLRPESPVNRAEFVTIAMRLHAILLGGDGGRDAPRMSCFPDIPANAWYEIDVCDAKEWGFVSGNALPGLLPQEFPFEPDRGVRYAEAVKIFAHVADLPFASFESGGPWFEAYLAAAAEAGIELPLTPGVPLTRGEVIELGAAFLAHVRGDLPAFRAAQRGEEVSFSSVSSQKPASSASSKPVAASSSSSKSWTMDTHGDARVRSHVLLLGEVSGVLGSVELFNNQEPFDLREVRAVLADSVTTVESLLVYDEAGRYLGRATLDSSVSSGDEYRLSLAPATLTLGRREAYSIYVRAQTRDFQDGGVSGEEVRVDSVEIEGVGIWSSEEYSDTLIDTFPTSVTARAEFTEIENAGPESLPLIGASDQVLARIRFSGREADGTARLRLTALTFQISASSGVSVSDPVLSTEDGAATHACSVASSTVVCTSIGESVGTVGTDTVLKLIADVTAPGSGNASLVLSLGDAGTPSSAGAITWTDGSASFSWLPFETPVVRATVFAF